MVDDLDYGSGAYKVGPDAISEEIRKDYHLTEDSFTSIYVVSIDAVRKIASQKGDMAGWVTEQAIDNHEKTGEGIYDFIEDIDLIEAPEKLLKHGRQ